MVFIVQGKPRSPEGILKVIKGTRQEAVQAVICSTRAWPLSPSSRMCASVDEFALTISDARD
jgi:hypothetical protein